jgi:hypothetical protein
MITKLVAVIDGVTTDRAGTVVCRSSAPGEVDAGGDDFVDRIEPVRPEHGVGGGEQLAGGASCLYGYARRHASVVFVASTISSRLPAISTAHTDDVAGL